MVGGLIGVGYQGRELAELVESLAAAGVSRLVDVRLTPLSRKRGFSKNALRAGLAAANLAYEHRPELGNPRDNRAGFAGSVEEREKAHGVFADQLTTPRAEAALKELAAVAERESVAVLCFEADEDTCHRALVLDAVRRRWAASVTG